MLGCNGGNGGNGGCRMSLQSHPTSGVLTMYD